MTQGFIGSNNLNEPILVLDIPIESRELSHEEHGFRKLLKRKFLGLASLEQIVAR
jgi:hypothetical protein